MEDKGREGGQREDRERTRQRQKMGEGKEPAGHLELRQETRCLASSESSPYHPPVGAGPGESERFQDGGRKEGWKALSPSHSATLTSCLGP